MELLKLGEFGLINKLTNNITYSKRVIKGIGDDTAVLESSSNDKYLLMTTDVLIEDIHFKLEYTPFEAIGYKALAVNISDIAAMGGTPTIATIALGIPSNFKVDYLEKVYSGLLNIAEEYNIDLVGGDTVKSPGPFFINITLLGEVKKENVKYRSSAKVNDLIGVTDYLGSSAAGLKYLLDNLENNISPYKNICDKVLENVVNNHFYPVPQVKAGSLLGNNAMVHAMNDISDGLASELYEISQASQTGFIINGESIPIQEETKEFARTIEIDPLEWALYGGEDFKLVFTCDPAAQTTLEKLFDDAGLKIFFIGKIVEEGTYQLVNKHGEKVNIVPKGYNHFR